MTRWPDTEDLAKVAYSTYCVHVGGVAFNGDALPTWDEQAERNPKIAEAWRASAIAVLQVAANAAQA